MITRRSGAYGNPAPVTRSRTARKKTRCRAAEEETGTTVKGPVDAGAAKRWVGGPDGTG